jgi:hypothetical protein
LRTPSRCESCPPGCSAGAPHRLATVCGGGDPFPAQAALVLVLLAEPGAEAGCPAGRLLLGPRATVPEEEARPVGENVHQLEAERPASIFRRRCHEVMAGLAGDHGAHREA